MKKQKIVCIVTIVILSVLYAAFSWIESCLGLMLLSLPFGDLSAAEMICLIAGVLCLLAPVFCITGIVLSIIQLRKEKYAAAFILQFLPVFTTVYAVLIFLVSMVFGNAK